MQDAFVEQEYRAYPLRENTLDSTLFDSIVTNPKPPMIRRALR